MINRSIELEATLRLALEALVNCDLAFEECKDYPSTHDLVIEAIAVINNVLKEKNT